VQNTFELCVCVCVCVCVCKFLDRNFIIFFATRGERKKQEKKNQIGNGQNSPRNLHTLVGIDGTQRRQQRRWDRPRRWRERRLSYADRDTTRQQSHSTTTTPRKEKNQEFKNAFTNTHIANFSKCKQDAKLNRKPKKQRKSKSKSPCALLDVREPARRPWRRA
jgi:hypothetical protein